MSGFVKVFLDAGLNRELVYRFARGTIALGCPEAAAAAVICFEWLQRAEGMSELIILGQTTLEDAHGNLNLTDIWTLAGSPAGQGPQSCSFAP